MPKMLPALVGTPQLKERFGDEDYDAKLEDMFRVKFLENLNVSRASPRVPVKIRSMSVSFQMIEGLIRAWKDDTLQLEQFGLDTDFIKAKSDLIVGEPEEPASSPNFSTASHSSSKESNVLTTTKITFQRSPAASGTRPKL